MIDLLMTIGAALLSGLAMYFFGYRRAGQTRKVKETEKRLKDMKTAQEVRDEVEILDDAGLADRASKWLRK
jgi:preprotein translocase subunit YajC